MAKVNYNVRATHIRVEELNYGDFFLYNDVLYVFSDIDDNSKVVTAVLVDDYADDNSEVIRLCGDEVVEPVVVEIFVKGYCGNANWLGV